MLFLGWTQTICSTWLSQSSAVQEHTDNQGRAIPWFKPEMIHPEIKKLWTGLLITEFPVPAKWMGQKKVSDWTREKSQFVLLLWLKDPPKGMWTFSAGVLKSLLQHECSPVSRQCSWCPVLLGHCPMRHVSQASTPPHPHPTPPRPAPPPALVMACLDGRPAVPVLSLLQDLHGVQALRFLDGADTALLLLQLQDRRRLPRGRLLHRGPGHSCGRGLGSGWGCGRGSATGCWCWQLLWGALATHQQVLPRACGTRGTWAGQDRRKDTCWPYPASPALKYYLGMEITSVLNPRGLTNWGYKGGKGMKGRGERGKVIRHVVHREMACTNEQCQKHLKKWLLVVINQGNDKMVFNATFCGGFLLFVF